MPYEGLPDSQPRGSGLPYSLAPPSAGQSHLGSEPGLTEQTWQNVKKPTPLTAVQRANPASGKAGLLCLQRPPFLEPKLPPLLWE